jgi:NAD-reducing hydrogenase small subunit
LKPKARIATVWLDGCSGCHMSILDLDETIAAVAELADVVYGPLVDAYQFPENVDVTVVEGAVSSQDDLRLVQKVRKNSRLVVALGDCAVTANVPGMRNTVPAGQLLRSVYPDGIPKDSVPPLLKQAVPLHEVVPIDIHVPGCPPKPEAIGKLLLELLAGRKPELAGVVKFG